MACPSFQLPCIVLSVGCVATCVAAGAFAQNYPVKPVRVVVSLAPAGGMDLTARMVALKLTERLGQQFVVENRPGAGGRTRAVNRVPACGM